MTKNIILELTFNANFLSVCFFHSNGKHFFELKTEQVKHINCRINKLTYGRALAKMKRWTGNFTSLPFLSVAIKVTSENKFCCRNDSKFGWKFAVNSGQKLISIFLWKFRKLIR